MDWMTGLVFIAGIIASASLFNVWLKKPKSVSKKDYEFKNF